MMVSIVVPTLNEEGGIGPTLDAVPKEAFRERGWTWEALVVDGGSKDATAAQAEARGARVIVDRRRGYGRAYKTGFAEAQGDILITGDADGTYPLERCVEYIDLLETEGLDFLTCDRYADIGEGAMSGKHHLGNWILSTTARMLYWVRMRDSQSGMWVFRRNVLEHIPIDKLSDGMPFSQEIKVAALKHPRLRAREVPGALRSRIGDAVIMSWQDGFGNLMRLVVRRFQRNWLRA